MLGWLGKGYKVGSLVGVSRMDGVRNKEVRRRAAVLSIKCIEMVWACGNNELVSCGQKGVDGGSRWRAGKR